MFGLIPFVSHNVDEFGGEFGDYLSDFFSSGFSVNKFNADVKETDNEYLVYAELPGVNKEDINLDYSNNSLTIRAKREEYHDDSKDNYLRKERYYGEFSRSFYLGNVNREGIRAKFEDGKLKVVLPKEVSTQANSSNIFIE